MNWLLYLSILRDSLESSSINWVGRAELCSSDASEMPLCLWFREVENKQPVSLCATAQPSRGFATGYRGTGQIVASKR